MSIFAIETLMTQLFKFFHKNKLIPPKRTAKNCFYQFLLKVMYPVFYYDAQPIFSIKYRQKRLYDIINVSFQCMNNIRDHHVFNNESKYSMGHSKRYLLEDGLFSPSIAHSGRSRAHSRSYNARCIQQDGSP